MDDMKHKITVEYSTKDIRTMASMIAVMKDCGFKVTEVKPNTKPSRKKV